MPVTVLCRSVVQWLGSGSHDKCLIKLRCLEQRLAVNLPSDIPSCLLPISRGQLTVNMYIQFVLMNNY